MIQSAWSHITPSHKYAFISIFSAVDPYQILGPTSSRLANPGKLWLTILFLLPFWQGLV
jgi:hypothetical protein